MLVLGAAAAMLLVVALMGVAPSRASAYWQPLSGGELEGWFNQADEYTGRYMTREAFVEYAETVAAGAESQTGSTGAGFTSEVIARGEAATEVIGTASSGVSTAVGVRQAMGSELGLMAQLKAWGPWKAFGSLGLALTAFQVGWSIGGAITDIFSDDPDPAAESNINEEAVGLVPVEKGENYCEGEHCWQVPAFGWIVEFENLSNGNRHNSTTTESCEGMGWTWNHMPEGAEFHALSGEFACGPGHLLEFVAGGVWFVPLEVTALPGLGVPTESPHSTHVGAGSFELGEPLDAPEATEKAIECLESKYCNELAGHTVNHTPGVLEKIHVAPGFPVESPFPNPTKVKPAEPEAEPETETVTVPSPATGERFDVYIERLEALGLIGSAQVLSESAIDTTKGPEQVTSTSPAAGTQVAPGSTIRVRYNPADAPDPVGAGTGGGTCNNDVDGVDLSPLNLPLSSKFPFGVFAFFANWIGEWTATTVTPHFDVHLVGGLTLHVDLGVMEPLVEPLRIAILFSSFVGLLWFLGTAGMKLQGDGS